MKINWAHVRAICKYYYSKIPITTGMLYLMLTVLTLVFAGWFWVAVLTIVFPAFIVFMEWETIIYGIDKIEDNGVIPILNIDLRKKKEPTIVEAKSEDIQNDK